MAKPASKSLKTMRAIPLLGAASVAAILLSQVAGCSALSSLKGKPAAQASVAAQSSPAAQSGPASAASPSTQATPAALATEAAIPPDALIAQPPRPQGPHQTVAHIVASVDGEPITARDVEQFSTAVGHPVNAEDIADDPAAKAALKALISQKLLEKEIDQYSSKVDEEQIDNYIEVVRRDKHMTPEQFKAAVAQSGMSMEDFRKHAREELEKEMMIRQQVRQRVEIPNADIQAYYDEHKADFTVASEKLKVAQILIGVPQNATPQQIAALQAKADKIRAAAAGGADFAVLARKYSDDESRNNGGELGWFGPQDILDQIYSAVKNLKPGDVSQVVRTSHGFHILKLEEHQVAGLQPLAEVKEQIRNQLINQRANVELENWVETDLTKQHDVETFY
jgi:peptidyl-prolyl cis-trans isomerase SurA